MSVRTDFRSELSKAKGLGSAKHGVGHWWQQRVTAVALIPLSLWFFYSVLTAMLSPNVVKVAEWFSSPLHAIFTVLLLIATFVHAQLGIQVVVEDYVKAPVAKYLLLLANIFINYGFAVLCILAVLKLHFLDLGASM